MLTHDLKTHFRPIHSDLHDRRVLCDRRISPGRRDMVRFDKTGGDRRSGYARRTTDMGFIKQAEDN